MNGQDCKKKVADNIKLCLALLKQREKEMIEEIESRREENEQALVLQQVFLFSESMFAVPSNPFEVLASSLGMYVDSLRDLWSADFH